MAVCILYSIQKIYGRKPRHGKAEVVLLTYHSGIHLFTGSWFCLKTRSMSHLCRGQEGIDIVIGIFHVLAIFIMGKPFRPQGPASSCNISLVAGPFGFAGNFSIALVKPPCPMPCLGIFTGSQTHGPTPDQHHGLIMGSAKPPLRDRGLSRAGHPQIQIFVPVCLTPICRHYHCRYCG
jgi:hypothetical protein